MSVLFNRPESDLAWRFPGTKPRPAGEPTPNVEVAYHTVRIAMVKVVVRLNGRSAFAKLDTANFVVSKMTGNVNFPTLAAQVTALKTACTDLDAAIIVANSGDHEAVGQKEMAEALVVELLAKLCASINGVAAGDRAKLNTCGLPLRKDNRPVGELPPPIALIQRPTTTSGRVALEWQGVHGAKMFNLYRSDIASPYNWVLVGTSTKTKGNIDNLKSGTDYWFAVSAVGTAGESSLSKALPAMAA